MNLTQENIQEILARHDPMGLLEAGSHVSEYAPEAQEIFEVLETAEDEDVELTQPFILETITDTFATLFDLEVPFRDVDLVKGLKQSSKEVFKLLKLKDLDEDEDDGYLEEENEL